jgi:hypothetical protein
MRRLFDFRLYAVALTLRLLNNMTTTVFASNEQDSLTRSLTTHTL